MSSGWRMLWNLMKRITQAQYACSVRQARLRRLTAVLNRDSSFSATVIPPLPAWVYGASVFGELLGLGVLIEFYCCL